MKKNQKSSSRNILLFSLAAIGLIACLSYLPVFQSANTVEVDASVADVDYKEETAKTIEIGPSKTVNTLILHKVRDYKTWKAGFDAAHADRRNAGELSYEVGTLHDDPSMVYVFNSWNKEEDFRNWMANVQSQGIMEKIGVKGEPTFIVFSKMKNNPAQNDKVKTLIYHKVKDFYPWNAAFNNFEPNRMAAGELSYEIGYFKNDTATAYVINEWNSVEAFKNFIANPELKSAMEAAGVIEAPHFLVFNKDDASS